MEWQHAQPSNSVLPTKAVEMKGLRPHILQRKSKRLGDLDKERGGKGQVQAWSLGSGRKWCHQQRQGGESGVPGGTGSRSARLGKEEV